MKHFTTLLSILLICLISTSSEAQTDEKKPNLKDQVVNDDLIVDGSSCVGTNCLNGIDFGFDTQRYREDNLRIHFEDTSTDGGSFPYEDWRIVINELNRFGRNVFMIEDETNEIFSLEAGAPKHAIYVEKNFNSKVQIGFGTTDPDLSLHTVAGDSPGLRLEQNGASGFTPQTWDMVGNEANFFIRDATAENIPFKIKPGAPEDALYIDEDGNIGLGTDNPEYRLHIEGDIGMTGAIYGVSDVRLKEETGNINDALDVIQKLAPKKYKFKNRYDHKDRNLPKGEHYGFYAQDVQDILPDLVSTFDPANDKEKSDEDLLSINYIELIPILTKGIQELQVKVAKLEQELQLSKQED